MSYVNVTSDVEETGDNLIQYNERVTQAGIA